jgi:LuxR family maltose regulon positive regulatory protein
MLGNISRPVEVHVAYKTPRVSAGVLCDDRTAGPSITLDSPDWFAWLAAPENCAFSYALVNHTKGYIDGFMTVRKERRQRGGPYWTAYRRHGRRVRKIYLGPSASLTEARLVAVAARLDGRDDQHVEAAACPESNCSRNSNNKQLP